MENVPDGVDVASAQSRVDVGRELLTGGRRSAARALAESDVAAASARLALAERQVAALADRALVAAAGWSAVAGRLAAEDSLLTGAEASLRTRFAVGGARYVDVLRLRTERLRVQTDRASAATEALAERRTLEGLAAGDTALLVGLAAQS